MTDSLLEPAHQDTILSPLLEPAHEDTILSDLLEPAHHNTILSPLLEHENEDTVLSSILAQDKVRNHHVEARQRKVSHRKIIIHDNGEVCAKTYNRMCPHEDDPDHQDPPMYHEAEGTQTRNNLSFLFHAFTVTKKGSSRQTNMHYVNCCSISIPQSLFSHCGTT